MDSQRFVYFPEQASTYAEHVDLLYYGLIAICGMFVIVITFLLFLFAIRYRRRPGNEIAIETHEHPFMEVGWSVIPFVLGVFLFVWGAHVFLKLYNPPAGETVNIFAVGKQWMWKFQHPRGRREINDLHVPLGVPVKMTMISQDVIHSFYVPAFRVKYDVVPGRYTTIWFQPTKTGTFHLFCAEYCGAEHSRMVGKVHVLNAADYQKWLESPMVEGDKNPRTADLMPSAAPVLAAAGGAAPPAAAGASAAEMGQALLDSQGCRACHRTDSAAIAPQLEGIFMEEQKLEGGKTVKADENYIRESIRDPLAKVVAGFSPTMPVFSPEILNEEQINQIIEYIKSSSGSKR